MTYGTIEKYRVLIAFETNYDAVFTVEIFSFRRFYHILVAVRRRLNELHFRISNFFGITVLGKTAVLQACLLLFPRKRYLDLAPLT